MSSASPPPRRGGERVEADRRAQTADAILPALTAAASVLLLMAGLRLVLAPPEELLVALVMAGTGAVLGAVRLACAHSGVRGAVRRCADEVGLAACLLASVPAFTELMVTGSPTAAGGLVVFLLATGALLNDRRYSLLVTLVCLAQWLAVAAAHGLQQEWAPLTVLVLCAAVLARVLNALRCRAADQLATAEVAILEAAVTDDLTGLANRRGLLAAGAPLLLAADRDAPLACLYLDVDGLKATNDRFGHAAGDELVRATAQALLTVLRPGDVRARLGGDEFAALLPATTTAEAEALAGRLRVDLLRRGVQASAGVAGTEGSGTVEALLDAADGAMYAVKQDRRALPRPRTAEPTPAGAAPVAAPLVGPHAAAAPPAAPHAAPLVPTPAERHGTARPRRRWTDPAAASRADVRDLTRAGTWLHLAVAPIHLLLLDATAGPVMAAVSTVVAVGMASLHVLTVVPRLRGWSGRHADLLMCVAMLLLGGETVLYGHVVAQPWASLTVVLAVVAAGGTLVPRGHMALTCLLALAGWTTILLVQPGTWTWSGYPVLVSVAVAVLLHVTHHRTVDRLTAAQARVRLAALTDELTGLRNRRGFEADGRPVVEVSLRRGEHVSMLYLDLDGLKEINDVQGHAAGDRLIVTAARVLRRGVGPEDLCARLGGDEFTVLLHGCPPTEVPGRVRWLQSALAVEQVHASIGVAHLPRDGTSLDGLVQHADQVMLQVKQARRAARPDGAQILGGRSS
ncbi:diguanylate cyclase domain-containing protein [Aquipuribacter sp. MA13-6]|uniref:GGDEF domain-containing protein n=1 Tax=unclassified Aquipuribacter TaxID=2635084 RepID=UPI003EEDB40F